VFVVPRLRLAVPEDAHVRAVVLCEGRAEGTGRGRRRAERGARRGARGDAGSGENLSRGRARAGDAPAFARRVLPRARGRHAAETHLARGSVRRAALAGAALRVATARISLWPARHAPRRDGRSWTSETRSTISMSK
jgi:hypothetical protein